jgi:hypothetical protein
MTSTNKVEDGIYYTIVEVCNWIRKHRSHPIASKLVLVTSAEEMLTLYATVKDKS